MSDKPVSERVAVLETLDHYEQKALLDMQKRIEFLEKKMAYYDKMATRWGGMMIATIAIFSTLGMLWEKLGEKITGWLK